MIDGSEGIFSGISSAGYHAGPGVGSSTLKKMLRSPAHAMVKSKPSPALAFGSAFHAAMEHGSTWREHPDVVVKPDGFSARSKDSKAQLAEWQASGAAIVSSDEADRIDEMREHVLDLVVVDGVRVCDILCESYFERSHYSIDDDTGVLCKVRPDVEPESLAGVIIDWKTAASAEPSAWVRACGNFGYHISAAYYLDKSIRDADLFVWVVVEKEDPFGVMAYYAERDDPAIMLGRERYREALRLYAYCKEIDEWPGYKQEPVRLELPRYFF